MLLPQRCRRLTLGAAQLIVQLLLQIAICGSANAQELVGFDLATGRAAMSMTRYVLAVGTPDTTPDNRSLCADPENGVSVEPIQTITANRIFARRGANQLGWLTCKPTFRFEPAGEFERGLLSATSGVAVAETKTRDLMKLMPGQDPVKILARRDWHQLTAISVSETARVVALAYELKDDKGIIELRSLDDGSLRYELATPVAAPELVISPDGTEILAWLFSYANDNPYFKAPRWILWQPTRSTLHQIANDGMLSPWKSTDTIGPDPRFSLPNHSLSGYTFNASFSPDGKSIAISNTDSDLLLMRRSDDGQRLIRRVAIPGAAGVVGHYWLSNVDLCVWRDSDTGPTLWTVSTQNQQARPISVDRQASLLLGAHHWYWNSFLTHETSGAPAVVLMTAQSEYWTVDLSTGKRVLGPAHLLRIGVGDSTPKPPETRILPDGNRLTVDDGIHLKVLDLHSDTVGYTSPEGISIAQLTTDRWLLYPWRRNPKSSPISVFGPDTDFKAPVATIQPTLPENSKLLTGRGGVVAVPEYPRTGVVLAYDANLRPLGSGRIEFQLDKYLGYVVVAKQIPVLLGTAIESSTDPTTGKYSSQSYIWSSIVGDGMTRRALATGSYAVNAQFSADGRTVAMLTRSSFSAPQTIRVWRIDDGGGFQEVPFKRASDFPLSMQAYADWTLSDDGRILAINSVGGLTVLDIESSRVLATAPSATPLGANGTSVLLRRNFVNYEVLPIIRP